MRPADGRWAVGQLIGYSPTVMGGLFGSVRFRVVGIRPNNFVDIVCVASGHNGWPKVDEQFFHQSMTVDSWVIYEEGTDDPDGIP